jgi:D-alanine-D-alanine ligase
MRAAVVWNNDHSDVINRFGQPSPERYGAKAVDNVVRALQENAHDVLLSEADTQLFRSLLNFMPPDPEGRPMGMVFNMAYGMQGECRYTHLPAMLKFAGVPYTGSGPLGHTLALDKGHNEATHPRC